MRSRESVPSATGWTPEEKQGSKTGGGQFLRTDLATLGRPHLLAVSQETFSTLKNWVKELRQHGPPNIVVAIAGNKCDLIDVR